MSQACAFRSILIFASLVCAVIFASPAAARQRRSSFSLKNQIETILSQSDLSEGFWGIDIELLDGRVLYSLNENKLFVPASDTKLFTTAAGLALIGSKYRVQTTVETNGALDKYGRLSGDLILIGRGDPTFSGGEFPFDMRTQTSGATKGALELLADQVAQRGVKYVDGDIVADDSYYAFEPAGEGWSDDDLIWPEGAPVSALTIDNNIVFVQILPAEHSGEKAFISLKPLPEYYTIDNRLITAPAGGAREIYVNRHPGSKLLTFWGRVPAGDPGKNIGLAIDDPTEFAATMFRRLLELRGIVIYGHQRTHHLDLATLPTLPNTIPYPRASGDEPNALSAASLVLAKYESPPLIEDIYTINKVSQNLHAELLLRLLGREKGGNGTAGFGLKVLREFISDTGIPLNECSFFDGSGLSRENLVTPHAIVQLLRYAATQTWAPEFRDSLPIARVDRSLIDRLGELNPKARVYAKPGSLEGVKAFSGYIITASGRKLTFSILVNNLNAPEERVIDAIDTIVESIANEY